MLNFIVLLSWHLLRTKELGLDVRMIRLFVNTLIANPDTVWKYRALPGRFRSNISVVSKPGFVNQRNDLHKCIYQWTTFL